MTTAANTTMPAMITNTFELWQTDHGHQAGGVHDGVVHGMKQSGINTLEPAPL
jgi:hypothetical protein